LNDALLAMIRRAVAPIQRRIMLAVGRAVILASRDAEGIQTVKVSLLAGELRDRVERFQEYGFTSVPLDGCEAVAVFVGGDRGHGLIVATDDRRHRKAGLQPGEVAIYTDEGDTVHIKRGGTIEITASTKVLITAPEAEITGNLSVGGDLDVTGQSVLGGITFDSHTHPGDSGGTTGPPQ
jgi:phage gp45-like